MLYIKQSLYKIMRKPFIKKYEKIQYQTRYKGLGYLAKITIFLLKGRWIKTKYIDVIFIGYAHSSDAYGFLLIKFEVNDISNKLIIEARDATYLKNNCLFNTKVTNQCSKKKTSTYYSYYNTNKLSTNFQEEPQVKLRKVKDKKWKKNLEMTFLLS